jgi:hypothetical protein
MTTIYGSQHILTLYVNYSQMTSTRNDKVKVQLRVFKSLECYPGGANDYFVAVVGPGIQLGNDNPEIAPRCKPIGRNVWEKDLW